jgi:tRNA U34 5-methylaminomethyl-2-thiouridine-forming methyltransferase MnmC
LKTAEYSLVRLRNGAHSVRASAYGETFHPVIGPAAEAEALHVRQLHLPERLGRHVGEFVIWDVGLGAAANALAVLRALRDCPAQVHLISFDHTLEPLRFALAHATALPYLADYREAVEALLRGGGAALEFSNGQNSVRWSLFLDDFPSLLARWRTGSGDSSAVPPPAPHAILYDPFSPAKNPAMWTLPVFVNLHQRLESARPCALATYSRSTLLRVTLLLAGFYVGVGHATGEKEETTIAANTLELIEEPLPLDWLGRVRRSTSAEPLSEAQYRQERLSPESLARLEAHPQFNPGGGEGICSWPFTNRTG